jgi:transposase
MEKGEAVKQTVAPATQDWREGRRYRALELRQQGWTQQAIAEALGMSQGWVSQIVRAGETQGFAGLQKRRASGAPLKLKAMQRQELLQLLEQGAEAHGFSGDLWTSQRIVQVIEQQFGVTYHEHHIPKLLRACGWSPQKPVVRASQRDEAQIQAWQEQRWSELKKSRSRRAGNSVY